MIEAGDPVTPAMYEQFVAWQVDTLAFAGALSGRSQAWLDRFDAPERAAESWARVRGNRAGTLPLTAGDLRFIATATLELAREILEREL